MSEGILQGICFCLFGFVQCQLLGFFWNLKVYPNDENMCSVSHAMVYPGFNTSDVNAYHCRSTYQSMANLMDIIIGNITTLLKDNNLWDDTLLIFTGDNGGPENNKTAANNHPLRYNYIYSHV